MKKAPFEKAANAGKTFLRILSREEFIERAIQNSESRRLEEATRKQVELISL